MIPDPWAIDLLFPCHSRSLRRGHLAKRQLETAAAPQRDWRRARFTRPIVAQKLRSTVFGVNRLLLIEYRARETACMKFSCKEKNFFSATIICRARDARDATRQACRVDERRRSRNIFLIATV